MAAIKRRKPKAERKERPIMVRVTDGQKDTLAEAAKASGLDLSSWIRSIALREAAKVSKPS
jgi:uncharacterized protein (DUF1778 family)